MLISYLVSIIAGLFLFSETETKLTVDTSRGERLHVNVSIQLTPRFLLPHFLILKIACGSKIYAMMCTVDRLSSLLRSQVIVTSVETI